MPTRNINLTPHLDRFIETRVASGRYGNASEVVREGLRLLQQREEEERAKLKWLRAAVQEGLNQIDRGESTTYASMAALQEDLDRLAEEASAEIRAAKPRG